MKRSIALSAGSRAAFARVRRIGLTLPDVEAAIRWDGSPVLKLRRCFLAGLADEADAEPGTLVVRMEVEDRELLLRDAPETYYVTDRHARYPVVLALLSRIDDGALRDLLRVSWRLTAEKARPRRQRR